VKEAWLLRDGDVLASAQIAHTLADKTRGLLGRDGYEGAMLLPRTRSVHSAGMRFALDVAFLDKEMVVVATVRLRPWSLAPPRRGGRHVLEAQAGAFERWRLLPGDRVEVKEPS
jgi:uncharacterized membrane protein (UPF0127 family)